MKPSWKKDYVRYRSFFLNVMATYKRRADLKVYLEIFLSLITISLFSIFALRPTLVTIAELIKDIETKREIIEKMDYKIENLSKAQLLYDKERKRIQLIDTSVPMTPSPEDFARQIEGLSSKHAAVIESIIIGKAVLLGTDPAVTIDDKDKLEEIKPLPGGARELAFSTKNSTSIENFSSLYNLLIDMENLRSPVKIDSINFQVIKQKENTEEAQVRKIEIIVNGRLPYYKEATNTNLSQNN